MLNKKSSLFFVSLTILLIVILNFSPSIFIKNICSAYPNNKWFYVEIPPGSRAYTNPIDFFNYLTKRSDYNITFGNSFNDTNVAFSDQGKLYGCINGLSEGLNARSQCKLYKSKTGIKYTSYYENMKDTQIYLTGKLEESPAIIHFDIKQEDLDKKDIIIQKLIDKTKFGEDACS